MTNALYRDSFWALLGNTLGKLLSLISVVYLAKILGRNNTGEFGLLRDTMTALGIFSTFGLGYSMTTVVSQSVRDKQINLGRNISTAYFFTLVISLVTAIVCFIFSEKFSDVLLGNMNLDTNLKLISIAVIFYAISAVQTAILSGFKLFKEMARANFLIGTCSLTSTLFLSHEFFLRGALIALIIVQIFAVIIYHRLISRQTSIKWNWDLEIVAKLLKISTPLAVQETVYYAYIWALNYLLISYGSIGDIGMYNVSLTWYSIVLFVPGILRNVVLSHLSSSPDNQPEHMKILQRTIIMTGMSTSILAIVVVSFSSKIEAYYGGSFEGLGTLLKISMITAFFTSISNVYTQAYLSIGKNWLIAKVRLIREIIVIVIFICLLKFSKNDIVMNLWISQIVVNCAFAFIVAQYYHRRLYI